MGGGHASILCCLAGAGKDMNHYLNHKCISVPLRKANLRHLSLVFGVQMRRPAPMEVGCLTTERPLTSLGKRRVIKSWRSNRRQMALRVANSMFRPSMEEPRWEQLEAFPSGSADGLVAGPYFSIRSLSPAHI